MIKMRLILCTLFIVVNAIIVEGQSLEIDGDAKITMLPTDNTATNLVVQQAGGALAVRDANTLGGGGGGLSGIEKVIDVTSAETVNDGNFPLNVAEAVCPVGKFVIGGTCSDAYTGGTNALDEWFQGGSGSSTQQANDAFGRTYSCRSRNSSGMTLNNLVITATAVCASIP